MNNKQILMFAAITIIAICSVTIVQSSMLDDVDATDTYELTLQVDGIRPTDVFLMDMGDRSADVSGHNPGDNISGSAVTNSTTASILIQGNNTANIAPGTYVGIWISNETYRTQHPGTIAVASGNDAIGCYNVNGQSMFVMPSGNTTVTLTWTDTHHVTVFTDDGVGSCQANRVSGATLNADEYFLTGETVSLTQGIDFNTAYQMDSMEITSGTVTNTDGFTFVMGETDVTVKVKTSLKDFLVTARAGGTSATNKQAKISAEGVATFSGGTITFTGGVVDTSAGKIKAKSGDTISFVVTPDEGYALDSLKFSGITGGDINTREFIMPEKAVTIGAKFKQLPAYNVTIADTTGGTVVPSKTRAQAGDEITLTVTADKGYYLKSLSSSEVSLTRDTRTFIMPGIDVTITPEFEQMAQLNCLLVSSSGKTILDVNVAASIGTEMSDPMFLIAGTYDGDIVINAYSHIKVGTDHTERVALSSNGLQEVFIQLVDGISSDPTGYYCVYTVESGA